MKIQNSHLKALVSLTDKHDLRYYVNRIAVHGNLAYSSNSYIALRVPVKDNDESKVCLNAEKLDLKRRQDELMSKSNKLKPLAIKLQDVSLDVEPTGESYPPIEVSYTVVEEQQETITATYNLDHLLELLTALKTASTQNIKTVTLEIGNVNKPMIVRLRESEVTGIIVPVR